MIVAFRKGGRNPVLLSHYGMKDGKIQHGWVENGGWEFVRVDGVLCIEGDRTAPLEEFETLIEIPTTLKGDYNDLITWAEGQLK